MPEKRAFVANANANGDSNALESDLDEYQQFRLPNGNFVVVGSGTDLDSKLGNSDQVGRTPPGLEDGRPFETDEGVAAEVAKAEAALSQYAFDGTLLSFGELFEHPTLSARTNKLVETDGLSVQEDDAQYRETTQNDWTERFAFRVPESYSGPLKFDTELAAPNGGVAHVRVLRDGETAFSDYTRSDTGIEVTTTFETVGEGESEYFKVEIRAVDPSPAEDSGVKARLEGISFTPEFVHAGNEYWLSEVSREPLPVTEFKSRVGL